MNTPELMEPEKQALNGQINLQLPYGLLGFETVKDYVLISRPAEAPFRWLKMLDGGRHAFLVLSPFLVAADYQPQLSDADVQFLELTSPADVLIVNIVTLHPGGAPTINLKGPVVINRHTRIGKQAIPNNAACYSVHHPLPIS
jgi:flagellar assembly factor FliW